MERPWLKLFTRDYLDHKELRRCSLPARGVWADMLCLMAEGSPRGYLTDKVGPLSLTFISQRTYTPVRLMKKAIDELQKQQVLGCTPEGVYFSKKMVDDEALRSSRAEGGAKGGNPNLTVGKVNLDLKILNTNKVGPMDSSVLVSENFKKKLPLVFLEGFEEFTALCSEHGLAYADEDVPWMQSLWGKLSTEDKLNAIGGIRARVEAGEYDNPRYRPLAVNYLEKKVWNRAVRARNGSCMEGV